MNKLNHVKIGKKTSEQKEVFTSLEKFYLSREEVFNFYENYTKMLLDSNFKVKQDVTKGTELKILTPKQMLQRLWIALAQVKAGNIK